MASNTDERAASFLARMIRLENEKRENAEDRSELIKEIAGAGLLKEEIAGLKLAVKRHFEGAAKRQFRETAESFAEALGAFKDTPLAQAAIKHIKNDPGVRRAIKESNKIAREFGGEEIVLPA